MGAGAALNGVEKPPAPTGTPVPAPSSSSSDLRSEIERVGEPPAKAAKAAAGDELDPVAAAEARRRFLTKDVAPTSNPLRAQAAAFGVTDCQGEDLAQVEGGFVIDHFRYCEVTFWKVETSVCSFSVPVLGCLRRKDIGGARFRVTTAGYGWDATKDLVGNTQPQYNQAYGVTLVDGFSDVWGVAPVTPLTVGMACDSLRARPPTWSPLRR